MENAYIKTINTIVYVIQPSKASIKLKRQTLMHSNIF